MRSDISKSLVPTQGRAGERKGKDSKLRLHVTEQVVPRGNGGGTVGDWSPAYQAATVTTRGQQSHFTCSHRASQSLRAKPL